MYEGPGVRVKRKMGQAEIKPRLPRRIAALAVSLPLLFLVFAAPSLAAGPAWELTTVHGPTNVPLTPPVNEVQTITVSGEGANAPNVGGFRLEFEFDGKEARTSKLPFDATAKEVEAALEEAFEKKFKTLGKGNVTVAGGPQGKGEVAWTYTVTFVKKLGGREVEELLVEEEEASAKEEKEVEKEGKVPVEGAFATAVAATGSRDTVIYKLIPRNLSSAPTSSEVTVTDELPPGLLTKETPEGAGWTCKAKEKESVGEELVEGEGHRAVICTSEVGKVINPDSDASSITLEAYVATEGPEQVHEPSQLLNRARVSGGGAASAVTSEDTANVSSTPVPFGVHSFTAGSFGGAGQLDTLAGDHPYAATTTFFLNTDPRAEPQEKVVQPAVPGNIKDADVTLPDGFVGNPQTVPRCSQALFTGSLPGGPGGFCPAVSQVGTATVYLNSLRSAGEVVGIYNLAPPPGVPAEFGFSIAHKVPIRVDAHVVRRDGRYRVTVLSADVNEAYEIFGVTFTLWGIPQDASHDAERLEGLTRGVKNEEPPKPFLSNPSDCLASTSSPPAGEPPTTTINVDRWEAPGALDGAGEPLLEDPHWQHTGALSPPLTGCDGLQFKPSIGFQPAQAQGFAAGSTQADEPSGYTFTLGIPQDESPTGRATPDLKDTTVTLPAGVVVSPSGANGLEGCSDGQIDLESTEPGSCPAGSQVGEVTVETPLLEGPLTGRVYIGQPECSPCSVQDDEAGRLFRLFIEAEGSGVRVKLPGTAKTDPATGQLTTTFANNPQVPFNALTLTLKDGPRAPLANPQVCGTGLAATAELTPWSIGGTPAGKELAIPGTPPVALKTSPFDVVWDAAGDGCPATYPFNPAFHAGTESSQAGAYTNFDVTFERQDREQDLSGIAVTTPQGLLGKIAGVTRCAGAQAETGSCPASSQIATATSAAGAGSTPFVVSGPVYLTDGYKGAPFGLSIAVPANAGPFHLGTVIVRAAIQINPQTSAITITSDPLPQSIDGVPFRLKTVKVDVTRPEFMFNPTNCNTQSVAATLTGAPVQASEAPAGAQVSVPFTASGCSSLPFHPVLSASTQGKTSKANGASLVVKVAQKAGEAHIHKVTVQLPLAMPSRLTTIQKACTEAQFNANPAGCPEGSNVGSARAITPLLNAPLEGPAYLVSHGGAAFPDLVFLLQGEGVHIELVGHTDIKKGITYSRFETVPDAPISTFETTLPEGPHSALTANGNLCTQSLIAPTTIVAQNNAQVAQQTKIAVTGCGPAVSIAKTKAKGNALLVTVKLSQAGTVKISGTGLKATTKRGLRAGTRQITVPLSRAGRAAKRHHRKIKLRVSLTAGGQTATKTASVKA